MANETLIGTMFFLAAPGIHLYLIIYPPSNTLQFPMRGFFGPLGVCLCIFFAQYKIPKDLFKYMWRLFINGPSITYKDVNTMKSILG